MTLSEVLWIDEHGPRRVNLVKKIHNVMTWRQFAFHYIKCLEKRMIKKNYFLKTNYSRTWLIRTISGNALVSVSS